MEFQAIACRRKYAESNSTSDCQIISDLTYRGCRIEDLAIDFTLPGYPDYMLSGSSSGSVSCVLLCSFFCLLLNRLNPP